MKKLFSAIDRNCERWLLLTFYSMVVVTIGTEVVRRFALSYSSTWAEEVARYAFIYLVWIGTAAAVRDRGHIRIDVIQGFLGNRGKAVIYVLGDLVMLLVAVLALIYSFETLSVSMKYQSVTHGLGVAQAWFLAAVPFGFTLVCFRLIQSLIRDMRNIRDGNKAYEGVRLFD